MRETILILSCVRMHVYTCYLYYLCLIWETEAGSVITPEPSCYVIASLSPVHYQQIGTFRSVVNCLFNCIYAVDALITSRLSCRHIERCDNSCYRIKRRPRAAHSMVMERDNEGKMVNVWNHIFLKNIHWYPESKMIYSFCFWYYINDLNWYVVIVKLH